MFKLTKLIHFAPDSSQSKRDAFTAALRDISGLALVQPTLPGVYNGGDLIAHFQFDDEGGWRAAEPHIVATLADSGVRHADSVAYEGGVCGVAERRITIGIYRTLLLCVDPPIDPGVLERFEAQVRTMPHYIPAIRNWQFSRVAHASGTKRWSHVWEQEYTELAGLMGPYMMHPYHWAHIDRWFDPESGQRIVNTCLCHSFCNIKGSVIAAADVGRPQHTYP